MKKAFLLAALFLFMISVINCNADEIKGRVNSVNINARTINISGVTVIASKARIKNNDGKPMPFDSIEVGNYLEIAGSFTGPGQITAEVIERDLAAEDYISGTIKSFDIDHQTVDIGGVTIKIPKDAWKKESYDIVMPLPHIDMGNYIACDGKWSGPTKFMALSVEHQLAYERVFEELEMGMLTMHMLGVISMILFVTCYIPQIVAILKTKCVAGISVGMWTLCVIGCILGLIYVIWLKAIIIIINYIISLILSLWTLALIFYYRKKA